MNQSASTAELLKDYLQAHQQEFYRLAYSYTKNRKAALDVVQDSTEKAIRNSGRLKRPDFLKTWFYRILVNESLTYPRKNKSALPQEALDDIPAADACVGRVTDAIAKMGGVALITADHGNAERMVAEDGSPFTAHTTNPVPFCVVGYPCRLREGGRLADIAPTMLGILGLPQPPEMTGKSIVQ